MVGRILQTNRAPNSKDEDLPEVSTAEEMVRGRQELRLRDGQSQLETLESTFARM